MFPQSQDKLLRLKRLQALNAWFWTLTLLDIRDLRFLSSVSNEKLDQRSIGCILRLEYKCAAPLNGDINLFLQKVLEIQLPGMPLHLKLSRVKTKNEK